MSQRIVTYLVGESAWSAVERDLKAAGFRVTRQRRVAGNLLGVRVREGTDDEAEATSLVERHVPDVRRGPPVSPTHTVQDYRQST